MLTKNHIIKTSTKLSELPSNIRTMDKIESTREKERNNLGEKRVITQRRFKLWIRNQNQIFKICYMSDFDLFCIYLVFKLTILYSKLLYKMGHYFLDIQYLVGNGNLNGKSVRTQQRYRISGIRRVSYRHVVVFYDLPGYWT